MTERSLPMPAVVLISGNGSNLQAIIDAVTAKKLDLQLRAVISDQADAYGLQRAKQAGIRTIVINKSDYPDRAGFDMALMKLIDQLDAKLVILAGFMRILSDDFVNHYLGRLINIHPSLLPEFKGLNTHQRVLDAACVEHGASVHFVIPSLDAGPVIVQGKLQVVPGEDAETLAKRVLAIEHQIYPMALQWIAHGKVTMINHQCWMDGNVLEQPVQFSPKSADL